MIEAYLNVLELGYYELKFAFEGLQDENVWKRPAEGLLSVGEMAGHIAYWEAARLAGDAGWGSDGEPDLAKCRVSSPLIDRRFAYYSLTLAAPPSEQHLAMTAEQVYSELLRVHEEAVAHFKALNPDLESCAPKYHEFLKYAVFHVSYHVGQMFSARHLWGEKTPDN